MSPRGGWVVDVAAPKTLVAGTAYALTVILRGSTVSISVDGALVTSTSFNASVIDGAFGVLARGAAASFDTFRARTNDTAFNAATPRVTISDVSVNESAGTVTLTLNLSSPAATGMTVAWATGDGTAFAGSDYAASSGIVTFDAGSQTATVTIPLVVDGSGEPNEMFTFLLSNPVGVVFGDNTAVVTIVDGGASGVSVSAAATDASGHEQGPNPLVFTLTRTGSTTTSLAVNLSWTGTAGAGDYTIAVSGGTLSADRSTLTFAAGSATATLTITPVNDTAVEPTETVILTVLAGAGYAPGTVASATGSIDDNDVAIAVTASDATGAEQGADPIVFTVSRTGYLAVSTAINLAWSGTALAGSDYNVTVSGATLSSDRLTLTFAAGAATATITLTPIDDAAVEGNETATLTIASGISYTVGTPSFASATIADNDSAPVVSTISAAVTDGAGAEAATDPIVFTVTRSGSTTGTTTVNLTWAGTAALTTDYTVAVAGTGVTLSTNKLTLTFAAGATTATLTVTPVNDVTMEGSESVTMTIATGSGYTVGSPSSASASIADNDTASLSIADASRLEGDRNTSTVVVTVTLSSPSASQVTVAYSTGGGNATAGSDYQSKSGTLTFAPGQTTMTISIVIVGDRTRGEGNETFLVTLANAVGASITDNQAVVTILDDDGAVRAGAVGANSTATSIDAATARAVLELRGRRVGCGTRWHRSVDGLHRDRRPAVRPARPDLAGRHHDRDRRRRRRVGLAASIRACPSARHRSTCSACSPTSSATCSASTTAMVG